MPRHLNNNVDKGPGKEIVMMNTFMNTKKLYRMQIESLRALEYSQGLVLTYSYSYKIESGQEVATEFSPLRVIEG